METEYKKFKNKLKLRLTIVGAVIVGIFSILFFGFASFGSFLFSKNQVNPNTISMGCFSTTTMASNSVSISNANSMTDAQGLALTPYTLTIQNNCSNNVKSAYYIILKVNKNSFDSDYLKLSLDGSTAITFSSLSSNNDLYNYTLDTENYDEYYILKTGTVEASNQISFNLRVWIDENTAYESVQNKSWSANIEVVTDPYFADVTGSGKTLAYLYSLNQKINTKNPNIGETKDDIGTSYYFKNSSNFNFLKLGDNVFRILRVNGDGTLRLALNSAISGDIAYNSSTSSPIYTGSTLETAINSWYTSTLETNYDSDLTSETFCNDTSVTDDTTYSAYSRLSGNTLSPSLICTNDTDRLSLKIGTLTADEKVLTGYQIANDYWTMTPYSADSSTYNMFTSNGNKAITSTNKVVPVVNLSVTETRKLVGTGTSDDPFILDRENIPPISRQVVNYLNNSTHANGSISIYDGSDKGTNSHYFKKDPGIYNSTDTYGDTYFFRGNVTNNYVKFAGFYWRIIRINGDGTLRIIYDGTEANDNNCDLNLCNKSISNGAFNSDSNNWLGSNAYVGYMYGNPNGTTYNETHANITSSTIKTVVDTWYENNLYNKTDKENKRFSTYIADEIFCNDRSLTNDGSLGYGNENVSFYATSYRYSNYTFLCDHSPYTGTENNAGVKNENHDAFTVNDITNGNGDLTYPIGLITSDDAWVSGGNSNSYLTRQNSGHYIWTMSPYSGATFDASNTKIIVKGDLLSDKNYLEWQDIVPVINLNNELTMSLTGSGTKTDPFTYAGEPD